MRRSQVAEIGLGIIINAGGGPETGIQVGRALDFYLAPQLRLSGPDVVSLE